MRENDNKFLFWNVFVIDLAEYFAKYELNIYNN